MAALKPFVPSFVVQEEGSRKVKVYLNIPELRVKRSFPNFTKKVPSNCVQKTVNFQNQSFTFTLHVQTKDYQTKIYSMSVERLPSEIRQERCSIRYQRGGCWITLIKMERSSWMNKICDDTTPGLDSYENENKIP